MPAYLLGVAMAKNHPLKQEIFTGDLVQSKKAFGSLPAVSLRGLYICKGLQSLFI